MTDKRKKETPDIVGGVLSGKQEDPPGGKAKPAPAPVDASDEEKIKTTVYLSPNMLYKVDRVLAELRHADRSRRISRTDIIAAAVDLALAGVDEADPLNSDLARRIMTS